MMTDSAIAERHGPHPFDQRQALALAEPISETSGILSKPGPAIVLRLGRRWALGIEPPAVAKVGDHQVPVSSGQSRVGVRELQDQQRGRLTGGTLRDLGALEKGRGGGIESISSGVPHSFPLSASPFDEVPHESSRDQYHRNDAESPIYPQHDPIDP